MGQYANGMISAESLGKQVGVNELVSSYINSANMANATRSFN